MTLFCRMEVLHGIYGNTSAVRVGDFKLIQGEKYTPFTQRPLARGEVKTLMKPYTIWESELECANYPDAIGCWPDLSPCLFNVRFDPCERNNIAYFMPQTVEALAYSLKRYEDSAVYRTKRGLEDFEKDDSYDEDFKETLRKLKESRRSLDRASILQTVGTTNKSWP